MSKTILKRKETWYNPYFFEDREVENVNIFDPSKKEVIVSFKWIGSNNCYPLMEFPFETRKKMKADLSLSYAFYNSKKSKTEIFIPLTLLQNFSSEIRQVENPEIIMTYLDVSFDVLVSSYKYSKDNTGNFKSEETQPEITKITISKYLGGEYTEEGKQNNIILKKFADLGVNFSVTTLNRLKEVLTIDLIMTK